MGAFTFGFAVGAWAETAGALAAPESNPRRVLHRKGQMHIRGSLPKTIDTKSSDSQAWARVVALHSALENVLLYSTKKSLTIIYGIQQTSAKTIPWFIC